MTDAAFSYEYDTRGLAPLRDFVDVDTIGLLGEELDRLGWKDGSEFDDTNRHNGLHTASTAFGDLARRLFDDPRLSSCITYPHRLMETYALDRLPGGELPIHGGAVETLTKGRHRGSRDLSCRYTVEDGLMYSMRIKALLYLDDIETVDDGPLFYVEGSHKANFSFFRSFGDADTERLLRDVYVPAGTLLVINEALVHGARPKRSTDRRRRLAAFTFAPAFCVDWNELGSDDSIERSGYAVPETGDSLVELH